MRELRSQAERDSLTGLLNRDGLRARLAAGGASTGAILLMDIDHFKIINDVHGHLADLSGLLERADKALYRAKAGGRDRVEAADQPTTGGDRPVDRAAGVPHGV